jgi:hypothetical protein
VLGKKPDEEDENYKMMKKWEGSCDTAAGKLQAIHSDLQEMEKASLVFNSMDLNLSSH